MRLVEGKDKVLHGPVKPRLVLQLGHIERVRHEAHVKDEIRLDREPVLEAEGQHIHVHAAAVALAAEQVEDLAAELPRRERRRIEHEIRVVTHRTQQLLLAAHSLFHAHALPHQRMAPPRLLIAVDDGGGIRLQKQHAAVDTAGLQLLQGVDEHVRGLAGAHVVYQRHPVVPAAGGSAEPGEFHHHLRREIVHGIVADILQKRGRPAFAAAGQAGYNENFHVISSFPGKLLIHPRTGPPAPGGRRGPGIRPPAPGGSAPARRRRWHCRC